MADKSPLNGFLESVGIFSPQQKRALMLEQAMQAQQMELMKQQTALTASQNAESLGFHTQGVMEGAAKLGHWAGRKIGGKMGRTPSTPPPGQQQMPGIPMTDPSMLRMPEDGKMSTMLLNMAKEMWQVNPQGAFIAYQKALEMQQQEYENEATNAKALRDQAQAGNPGPATSFRDAAGNIVTTREERNALGAYIGDQELGRGPNRQETQDITDPLTDAAKSKEVTDFIAFSRNTDATMNVIRQLKDMTQKNGTPTGWTEAIVGFADKLQGTIKQMSQLATGGEDQGMTPGAQALLNDPSQWQDLASRTGIKASLWGDLVGEMAKLYNPTGVITEKDILRAKEVVGRNSGNPKTLVSVLEHLMKERIHAVGRQYDYLEPNLAASAPAKHAWDTFRKRNLPNAPQAAIDYLKANPDTKEDFRATFGYIPDGF